MRSDHRSRGAVSVSTAYRSIQKARVGFHTRFILYRFIARTRTGLHGGCLFIQNLPRKHTDHPLQIRVLRHHWCAAVSTAPALGEAGMASVSSTSRAVTLAVWLGTAITASTMYGL